MSFKLSQRSEKNLIGVQPALVAVVRRALELTKVDFTVIEGTRTKARQKKLVASGASQTMNSRHITGHAVDLATFIDGEIRWDWPPYNDLADAMKAAADELGVAIEWGGDWKSFKDGPHFQLSWAEYPANEVAELPMQKEGNNTDPVEVYAILAEVDRAQSSLNKIRKQIGEMQ